MTRREALILGAGALITAGCGSSASSGPSPTGSTIAATWTDRGGTGTLVPGPGQALLARTDLGPVRPPENVIATLAHVTDAHVLDASSPARVPFLDRLGDPFESTFRPQETLTAQVLAGATRAIRALAPDAVIQGGDLIDNDQRNELGWALRVLRGGVVRPGSGRDGYYGVQLASDPDPFYYRPDLDAPQHPGLLTQAVRPFTTPGINAPVYPVLGDHDILVAGELAPTAADARAGARRSGAVGAPARLDRAARNPADGAAARPTARRPRAREPIPVPSACRAEGSRPAPTRVGARWPPARSSPAAARQPAQAWTMRWTSDMECA